MSLPPRPSIALALVTLSLAAPLQAGVMLSPAAVLGTDLGEFSPTQAPLGAMIDQSGLDIPFTNGVTDFDAYFAATNPEPFAQNGIGFNWQSNFSFNLPLMGFVDFDLGAVVTFDQLAIWNRSLETGHFLVSETAGGPFTDAGPFALQNHLNFPFSYRAEIVPLNAAHQARYLRIEIDSTYKFDISDTFAYAIIGEVVVESLPTDRPPLPGDFDLDQKVDDLDLIVWRAAFGPGSAGDADFDGDSDGADFLIWQRNLGLSNAAPATALAAAAIPEPASLTLLLAAALAFVPRRRVRKA